MAPDDFKREAADYFFKQGAAGAVEDELFVELPPDTYPKPLEAGAYHGIAGRFVKLIEPHTESDPAALLVQLLAAAGCAIGRTAFFEVEGARHFPNLYLLLVGESNNGRKGTSWNHVRNLMALADPEFEQRRIRPAIGSGEGLIYAVRDGDKRGDDGEPDKRLLVIEPEFAALLQRNKREGSTISATVRDLFDSGRAGTLTKNHPLSATGAHVGIVGHITDFELRKTLSENDSVNGFSNRFLHVCSRRSKLLPDGGNVPEGDLRAIGAELAEILKVAKTRGRLDRSEQARDFWRLFYEDLSLERFGLVGAVLARGPAIVVRLSLIYALLDAATQIRPEHLGAAMAVWTYAAESAVHIFGAATGDPKADRILDALRSAGDLGMTSTEVSGLFGRNVKAADLRTVLAWLARAGRIRCETTETAGRPSQRWFWGAGVPK